MADDTTTVVDYLEHLVVAGISDRTSRSTDVAGRVVAVLLEALVTAGGASRAAKYLAPDPGSDCTLEIFGPDAEGRGERVALTELFERLADDGADAGTIVVAFDSGLLRRQVFEVSDDGAVMFLFPDPERLDGPRPAVDDARRRWAWTMSTWARRSVGAPSSAPLRAVASDTSANELVDAVRDVLAEEAARHDDSVVQRITDAMPPPTDLDEVVAQLGGLRLEVDADALIGKMTDAGIGAVDVDELTRRIVEALPRPAPLDTDALAQRLAEAVPQPAPLDVDALAQRLAEAVPQPAPLDTDALAQRLAEAVPQPAPLDTDALAQRLAEAVPQPAPLDTDALAQRLAEAVPQPTPLDTDALAHRLAEVVPQPTPLDTDTLAQRLAEAVPQPAPLDTDALAQRLAEAVPQPAPLDTDALAQRLAEAVPQPAPLDVDALAQRLAEAVPQSPPVDTDALVERLQTGQPGIDVEAIARRVADLVPKPETLDTFALVADLAATVPPPARLDLDALAERLAAVVSPAPDADELARRITDAIPAPPAPLDVDALVQRISDAVPAPPAPLDTDELTRRITDAIPAPPAALDTDDLVRRITDALPPPPAPLDVDALAGRLASAIPAPPSVDPDELTRRIVGAIPPSAPLDVNELAQRLATAPAPLDVDIEDLASRLRRETAADVADAVRAALSEVALEVDLGAIDGAVADAVNQALAGRETADRADSDELVERLTAALRPEPLDVDALANRLVPALEAPVELDIDRLADLVAERIPTPIVHLDEGEAEIRRLATQVVETLRPFLEAVGTSGQGTALAEAAIVSTTEQLHLQLQAFADRVASGTRSLTALAEEIAASTRDANDYADRLAATLGASVERLGRQIERRFNELQARDVGVRRNRNGMSDDVEVHEATLGGGDHGTTGSAPPA